MGDNFIMLYVGGLCLGGFLAFLSWALNRIVKSFVLFF